MCMPSRPCNETFAFLKFIGLSNHPVIEAVAGAVSLYGSTPDGKHVAMLCKDAASIEPSATISTSYVSQFLHAMVKSCRHLTVHAARFCPQEDSITIDGKASSQAQLEALFGELRAQFAS